MTDAIEELILTEYFTYETVLRKFFDGKRIMNILGKIFCISAQKTNHLFDLAENETIKDIVTAQDYYRYCRIKSRNLINGGNEQILDTVDYAVTVKGNAIVTAAKEKISAAANATQSAIFNTLEDAAAYGNIIALRLLGVLQCEGIFVEKNVKDGVKNIRKAAQWLNIPAIMAALRYSIDDRSLNARRLGSVLDTTPCADLIDAVQKTYGVTCANPDKETLLLKKAFAENKISPNKFDSLRADIIYSQVIGHFDKKSVLFSANPDELNETRNLPLRLKYEYLPVTLTAFKDLPVCRADELKNIETNLYNSDLRADKNFRPMCIVSKSEYMLEKSVSALTDARTFKNANIIRIDVSDLTPYDLDPTENNVFIRSCDENKTNVYVIVFKDSLEPNAVEQIKNFLKKRQAFRLARPSLTLDLSSILPICVCDVQNARNLEKLVGTVRIAEIRNDEKTAVIRDIVLSKSDLYKIENVKIDCDAADKLLAYSVETAETLIETFLKENRSKSKKLQLTAKNIDDIICCDHSRYEHGLGFGE